MSRKWMVLLVLLLLATGCPRAAQQQEPRAYKPQKQVEPRPHQQPSKPLFEFPKLW